MRVCISTGTFPGSALTPPGKGNTELLTMYSVASPLLGITHGIHHDTSAKLRDLCPG